jgi:hypothetical protein
MESSKLTDEELIALALEESESDEDLLDVGYYQQLHLIKDGSYGMYTKYLYNHYKNWSFDATSLEIFVDMLKLKRKDVNFVYIDRQLCNIDISKLVGTYVKKERKKQKEERSRKISSTKSTT